MTDLELLVRAILSVRDAILDCADELDAHRVDGRSPCTTKRSRKDLDAVEDELARRKRARKKLREKEGKP